MRNLWIGVVVLGLAAMRAITGYGSGTTDFEGGEAGCHAASC